MIHQKIKDETRKMHSDLEKLMFVDEIMDGSLTFEQYSIMLQTNYLVMSAYESQILESLNHEISLRLNMQKRAKSAALLKDLQEANISPNYFKGQQFKNIDPEFALGCLYVLEGATLGGNIIVKKLQTNMQLNAYHLKFNYYQVYGEQLGSYWKQFCEVINEQPEHMHQKIIEGAKEMYAAFMDVKLSVMPGFNSLAKE